MVIFLWDKYCRRAWIHLCRCLSQAGSRAEGSSACVVWEWPWNKGGEAGNTGMSSRQSPALNSRFCW